MLAVCESATGGNRCEGASDVWRGVCGIAHLGAGQNEKQFGNENTMFDTQCGAMCFAHMQSAGFERLVGFGHLAKRYQ